MYNVKRKVCTLAEKCVSESIASFKPKKRKKIATKSTINNMKCSAVRKDFWCLTNKVNPIKAKCQWFYLRLKRSLMDGVVCLYV